MHRSEVIEIELAGLLPAIGEQRGESIAQRMAHAHLGLGQCPWHVTHGCKGQDQRFVDRGPAIDERVVPIEDDGTRDHFVARRHSLSDPPAAAYSAYDAASFLASGPGFPSPTATSSIRTTGTTKFVLLVRSASAACMASATLNGRSLSPSPEAAITRIKPSRVTPFKIP